jgi:hypothetical protein
VIRCDTDIFGDNAADRPKRIKAKEKHRRSTLDQNDKKIKTIPLSKK